MTQDLVNYGGTCPKCLAEIPGDEAPTDPGAEVRAAQAKKDRRGRTVRIAVGLALLLSLVTCTGGSALYSVLKPKPQVAELLNFDELDIPLPDLVSAPPDAPSPESKKPVGNGGKKVVDVGKVGSPTAPAPSPGPVPLATPVPVAASGDDPSARPRNQGLGELSGPSDPTSAPPPSTPRPSLSINLDAPVARRDDNMVLSDPDAIRNMIGTRLRENIPQLRMCYDRRLKAEPTLKGRWLLKFNVLPTGRAEAASATGLERQDAELEACIVKHIQEHWRFGKITVTQPVQRTITLSQ